EELDFDSEEFLRSGQRVLGWIAHYLENARDFPVLSTLDPGNVRDSIPDHAPDQGEEFAAIIDDFDRLILPGITHWNHPRFFSYFPSSASEAGILGEFLCAALNVNAMKWQTSPAATELESAVAEWMSRLLGLGRLWGIIYDTASISTLHAMAAAREAVPGLEVRTKGLQGGSSPLRLYASEQSHTSVDKAALTLGLGLESVRKIPVDGRFRMRADALREAILKDRRAGEIPFFVTATVGTTSTASVDSIAEIAAVSKPFNLWLHVDAAYAGVAAVLPEFAWIFDGSESADSIVVNPHKWLFTPMDISLLFCRRPEILRRAFALVPDYLSASREEETADLMDYGLQLGRRFRALKLWMVLRRFGKEGLQRKIGSHIQWAKEFADQVDRSPNFELMAPPLFSTVCFRCNPGGQGGASLDELNRELLERTNASGKLFISSTRLNERLVLRLSIGNVRTRKEDVESAWEWIRRTAADLR
ncbi:MAG TPA: pyridoxal-dependent decarboxylase, partial [Acidobacteriota bacterium]|nr:pyridoxal-dependent decarboxylase [Acidobacteriota bacterium]